MLLSFHNISRASCFALTALAVAPGAASQILPEVLSGPGVGETPLLISDDGSVVAGLRDGTGVQRLPFRWSAEGGIQMLEVLGSNYNKVVDMSADGSLILGRQGTSTATLWDSDGNATLLGNVTPTAISRDGSTAVGWAYNTGSLISAFRWTAAGGWRDLGRLPGAAHTRAEDVSEDGSVVVGRSGGIAFRWSAATGVVALPGGTFSATSVSSDGQFIVGRSGPVGDDVFFWSSATGSQPIGGFNHILKNGPFISSDGSAAVWYSNGFGGVAESFRYDSATGVTTSIGPLKINNLSGDGNAMVASGYPTPASYWSTATGFLPLEFVDGSVAAATRISEDGRWAIGEVWNLTLGQDVWPRAAVRWSLDGEIGGRYCSATIANSTGVGAVLRALGTNVIDEGNVTLTATSLPAQTYGFFLASQTQDDVFPVAQSQGRLCLGGAVGRFVGANQIMISGPAGEFALALPLDRIATPTGLVTVASGDSWNFQAWYRDANPVTTSNFTNGVRVTFR